MLARFGIAFVAIGASLSAADVNGTWNMHWKTPDGYQHDSQLTLADASGKLTGEISSRRGKVKLTEGAISGDDIRFTVVRTGNGDEFRIQFSGKVQGDSMKLRMEYKDHPAIALTAKRASTQVSQGAAK